MLNELQHCPIHIPIAILSWAEARVKIARMTLTIKLDGNWNSFQLANSAPPLSVTDSAIAPSARMILEQFLTQLLPNTSLAFSLRSCLQRSSRALLQSPSPFCGSWSMKLLKNCESHIDASHSRQPLVKGERLVRYEVNAVMTLMLKTPCLWPYIFASACSHDLLPQTYMAHTFGYYIPVLTFCYPIGCAATGSVPCQRNT